MTFLINKISYIDVLKLSETYLNESSREKFKIYNNFLESYDGFWFDIEGYHFIKSNFFIAQNAITELEEGYLSFYLLDSKKFEKNIDSILKTFNKILSAFKNKFGCTLIYLNLIDFSSKDLIPYIEEEFEVLSMVINKYINDNENKNITLKNKGLIIREPKKSEYHLVMECLIKAYLNGTSPNIYEHLGITKFKENIKSFYTPLDENRLILVGEYEGKFCGHVSYSLEKDILSSNNLASASLIDFFILEEFNQLGLGSDLLSVGENYCENLGYKNIIGTIEVFDNREQNENRIQAALNKMDNLEKNSWLLNGIILLEKK